MAAAVAALAAAPGERSVITGFGATATSYPGFARELRRLDRTARSHEHGRGTRGATALGRRHRRTRRGRQVHRLARRGEATRSRTPRHRRHVPCRRRIRTRQSGRIPTPRPRSPKSPRTPRSRSGDRVVINGIDVTDDIRSRRSARPFRSSRPIPTVRRAPRRAPTLLGGRARRGGRRRARHRQRGLSRGGAQGLPDRIARRAGPAPP